MQLDYLLRSYPGYLESSALITIIVFPASITVNWFTVNEQIATTVFEFFKIINLNIKTYYLDSAIQVISFYILYSPNYS